MPVVASKWNQQQNELFKEIKSKFKGTVKSGGDGRSDSPGHSAKYGSYTIMELRLGKIIDQQLVQVSLKMSIH